VLAVESLTKQFQGFLAIKGVSFELAKGEILGLIGPNGSGKSTIFNLIAGALKPTSGSIRLDGSEIGGLPADQICHLGLARTFQIPRPFRALTLLENVMLAAYFGRNRTLNRAEAIRQAQAALALAGLPNDDRTTPDGLGAAGLKKLELARALATRPRILLADESLGGLDVAEMDQAADMLRRIRLELGISIIWVEHIMAVLMRVVDRVIVLDHGEKIFQGSTVQAAHDQRVIDVYLGKRRP
jgi:branched-chain amino acid transport system ATP-binding protein